MPINRNAKPAAASPLWAGLKLRCPRCGEGRIYRGFLKTHNACTECGFNIKGHDAADGPAFFGITIVGILTAIFSTIVEVKYSPPLAVHALLWVPFILIGTVLCLILFKSLFIAAQFMFKVGSYEEKEQPTHGTRRTKKRKKQGSQAQRRA